MQKLDLARHPPPPPPVAMTYEPDRGQALSGLA